MYIACSVTVNDSHANGKYAYSVRLGENDNVCAVLSRVHGLDYANVFQTKKKAAEIVTAWNDAYKANGTYAFGGAF